MTLLKCDPHGWSAYRSRAWDGLRRCMWPLHAARSAKLAATCMFLGSPHVGGENQHGLYQAELHPMRGAAFHALWHQRSIMLHKVTAGYQHTDLLCTFHAEKLTVPLLAVPSIIIGMFDLSAEEAMPARLAHDQADQLLWALCRPALRALADAQDRNEAAPGDGPVRGHRRDHLLHAQGAYLLYCASCIVSLAPYCALATRNLFLCYVAGR